MTWLIIGLLAWLVILLVVFALVRAAAKPWPKRIERFRGDDDQ